MKKTVAFFLTYFIVLNIIKASDSDKINFLSTKSELQFKVDNSIESFTTHIRYKPKDSVWMSFTGLLGIEGARLLIDKDSVYVHNKLEKSYFTTPIQEKNEWIPFGFSIEDWDVLLTNTTSQIIDSLKKPLSVVEKKINDSTSKRFSFDKNKQLERYEIINTFSNERCIIYFSNFQKLKKTKMSFAHEKKIVFSSPGSSEIELTIKHIDYTLNQPKNMPFAKQR